MLHATKEQRSGLVGLVALLLTLGASIFLAGCGKGASEALFEQATACDSTNPKASEKDDAKAARLYQMAAEKGHARAMLCSGLVYKYGRGVQQDDTTAVAWYRKSIEAGEFCAYANLGIMYEDGRGVVQSYEEAIRCYERGAEKGDGLAMYNLGVLYGEGPASLRNDSEAFKWYVKAAEAGERRSCCNLGNMYQDGRGTSPDYQKAAAWYRAGAEVGQFNAMLNLAIMICQNKCQPRDEREVKMLLTTVIQMSNDAVLVAKAQDVVRLMCLGLDTPKEAGNE